MIVESRAGKGEFVIGDIKREKIGSSVGKNMFFGSQKRKNVLHFREHRDMRQLLL